ncbi:Hsp20/alpha crystallin family protein [Bacillus sp. NPDC093026]|uniref:Hsp20/alpha crystallin family protein n=1 Tax=Bacillus sp. NPDC093026 TaxID=3363948 RepID=UPI003805E5F3
MDNKKQSNSSDFIEIDDWLNLLMDDPFAWYDEQLPIDLYETSCEYIIEMDLSSLSINKLKLTFAGHELILAYAAHQTNNEEEHLIEKSMMLPFYLNDKEIDTDYENQIFSIKIKKYTVQQEGIFSFQMTHFNQ